MCMNVFHSSVPDVWFITDSILITLSGKFVPFVISKDKPRFSPSQFYTSETVKLCGHELLFPPYFAYFDSM